MIGKLLRDTENNRDLIITERKPALSTVSPGSGFETFHLTSDVYVVLDVMAEQYFQLDVDTVKVYIRKGVWVEYE